jgi:hypothetical protein
MKLLALLLTAAAALMFGQSGSTAYQTFEQGAPGATLRTAASKLADVMSVIDFGAKGDCVSDDAAAITAAATAAIAAKAALYFPRPAGGCYVINNSGGDYTITNATGSWYGEGAGSKISCTSLAHMCVYFATPSNFAIHDMVITFTPTRTTRCSAVNGTNLGILGGSNIEVYNVELYNTNCSAFWMQASDQFTVHDIFVHDALANGTFFVSDTNGHISNLTGLNLRDAVFELSNFDSAAHACNTITATNITSNFTGSNPNDGYILVNGCQNVSVSNASITLNQANIFAAAILQDQITTTTQVPDNVSFSNMALDCGGANGTYPYSCLAVTGDTGALAAPFHVSLSNITVKNANGNGVLLGYGNNGYQDIFIQASNIHVIKTGLGTLATGSDTGYGFLFGGAASINGVNLEADYAGCESFHNNGVAHLSLHSIRSLDPNQSPGPCTGNDWSGHAMSNGADSIYFNFTAININLDSVIDGIDLMDSRSSTYSNIAVFPGLSTPAVFSNINRVAGATAALNSGGATAVSFSFAQGQFYSATTGNLAYACQPAGQTEIGLCAASATFGDTANGFYLHGGGNLGLDNNSAVMLKDSAGTYRISLLATAGDVTEMKIGKPGGSVGLADSGYNLLFQCYDVSGGTKSFCRQGQTYTHLTIPACGGSTFAAEFWVSDSNTAAWGSTYAGGGSYTVKIGCNGTIYIVIGSSVAGGLTSGGGPPGGATINAVTAAAGLTTSTITITNPPTQAEVQDIQTKLNAVINWLNSATVGSKTSASVTADGIITGVVITP